MSVAETVIFGGPTKISNAVEAGQVLNVLSRRHLSSSNSEVRLLVAAMFSIVRRRMRQFARLRSFPPRPLNGRDQGAAIIATKAARWFIRNFIWSRPRSTFVR